MWVEYTKTTEKVVRKSAQGSLQFVGLFFTKQYQNDQVKDDEIAVACSTREKAENAYKFWSENLKVIDHSEHNENIR